MNGAVLHAILWLFKNLGKVLQSHFKHGGQNAQNPDTQIHRRCQNYYTRHVTDVGCNNHRIACYTAQFIVGVSAVLLSFKPLGNSLI